jgi:hypothetical protein
MFSKLASFAVLATAVSSVFGSPVDLQGRGSHHASVSVPSFNDWHGIQSLHGFDNFWGSHNFIGVSHRQVVLKQKQELVCHKQEIVIIQQRLVVLQEMAKKIITELVCEVETQTLVFEQFHAGLGFFRHDLDRSSKRHVGYDAHIAGLYHGLFDRDGSLSTWDLGFRGHHVGRRVIVPSGHNWNDVTSPPIIKDLYEKTSKAIGVDVDDTNVPLDAASVEPDVEVDSAADAPPDTDAADADAAGAADADAADADAADAEVSGAADDAPEAASATAASSSAAAPSASANIDPATAP